MDELRVSTQAFLGSRYMIVSVCVKFSFDLNWLTLPKDLYYEGLCLRICVVLFWDIESVRLRGESLFLVG